MIPRGSLGTNTLSVGRSSRRDCSNATSTAGSFMYACAFVVVGGLYQLEWESGAANFRAVRAQSRSAVAVAGLREY
jgi:hypothetical protein